MSETDKAAGPDDAWPPPPARSGQRLFVLKEGDIFLVLRMALVQTLGALT
jgi:hypothetical protein